MAPKLVTLAVFFLFSSIAIAQDYQTEGLAHGTINIALGNQNGIVVLTDSRASSGGQPSPDPAQKLFRLDDHTVCAVAGFLWGAAANENISIPELYTETRAVIYEYVRQSASRDPQTIEQKLRMLSYLLGSRLTKIANARIALHSNPLGTDDYRVQIIVAGYDVDHKPKIGREVLQPSEEYLPGLIFEATEVSIKEVGRKLIWKLNGISSHAENILSLSESGPPEFTVLREYAIAKAKDEGSSLSVEQMAEVAKELAKYTSELYPNLVGGPNQIAFLLPSTAVTIDQPNFSDPPRPLKSFILVTRPQISGNNAVRFGPEISVLMIQGHLNNSTWKLDGNIFIDTNFSSCVMTYDGGLVNLGNTNTVSDSVLLVGPLIRTDDKAVKILTKTFNWLEVQRDFSSGAVLF
jgi:hypothetical protein